MAHNYSLYFTTMFFIDFGLQSHYVQIVTMISLCLLFLFLLFQHALGHINKAIRLWKAYETHSCLISGVSTDGSQIKALRYSPGFKNASLFQYG